MCEKYLRYYVKLADTKIEKICDYNNYSQYATEPKLREKDYFYMLLCRNREYIKYMKAESVFQRLKDETMKCCYQWIRDNAKYQVENMYKYVRDKKYNSIEEQNEDIFLLIDIFPDAMKIYIDSEFVMNNWDNPKMNSFRDNYYKNNDNLLRDCRVKINMYEDRKLRTEKTFGAVESAIK